MNSFEICRLIGDAPKGFLSAPETCLLTRMALFGNAEGKNIYPGIKELTRQTKYSDRTVRRALESLQLKEVVVKRFIRRQGTHSKDCYEINIPLLQERKIPKNKYNRPNLITEPMESKGTINLQTTQTPVFSKEELIKKKNIGYLLTCERYSDIGKK